MSVTLLSFLGGNRGLEKGKPAYSEAMYQYKRKIHKTALFAQALLKIKEKNINQVIIFGTKTSIWEYLISEENNEDIYLDVLQEVESEDGISNQLLNKCQAIVSQEWGMSIILYAGESGITDKNAGSEMINYVEILNHVNVGNDILLDVTHGFRTMPVLLMSALQYQYALTDNKAYKNYHLTYGEYNHNNNSPIYFLDSLTDNFAIANACQLFFDKFESEELVVFLKPIWEPGAKAIKKLSVTLQGNYLLQIDERLRQLRNALDKKPESNVPPWFNRVFDEIEQLYKHLSAEPAWF